MQRGRNFPAGWQYGAQPHSYRSAANTTAGDTYASAGNTYARAGDTYARAGDTYARAGDTYACDRWWRRWRYWICYIPGCDFNSGCDYGSNWDYGSYTNACAFRGSI